MLSWRRPGGGESSTRAPELGSALAVLLCPLSITLALLAQPRPQVLGLGVGAFAQLVAVGCPLRSWRALLVQVSRRAPGPGSAPGPGAGLQAVSARSSGAVVVWALQRPRIVRAALVTVSAACRTRVRSPPAQPAT